MASEGRLDFEKVVEHFIKVNNCDRSALEKQMQKAFEQWEERSRYEWQVDLGKYKNIIKERR